MTEHTVEELIELCLSNDLSCLQVGSIRIENGHPHPVQPDFPAVKPPTEEEAEEAYDNILYHSAT